MLLAHLYAKLVALAKPLTAFLQVAKSEQPSAKSDFGQL
jgi:hypothetical protein